MECAADARGILPPLAVFSSGSCQDDCQHCLLLILHAAHQPVPCHKGTETWPRNKLQNRRHKSKALHNNSRGVVVCSLPSPFAALLIHSFGRYARALLAPSMCHLTRAVSCKYSVGGRLANRVLQRSFFCLSPTHYSSSRCERDRRHTELGHARPL